MKNSAPEIKKFLCKNGRNASKMTHVLKYLGNGSMENGLSRIEDYFDNERRKSSSNSLLKGAISGALGILTLEAITYITTKLIKKKKEKDAIHQIEGECIVQGLEKGLEDYCEFVTKTDNSDTEFETEGILNERQSD